MQKIEFWYRIGTETYQHDEDWSGPELRLGSSVWILEPLSSTPKISHVKNNNYTPFWVIWLQSNKKDLRVKLHPKPDHTFFDEEVVNIIHSNTSLEISFIRDVLNVCADKIRPERMYIDKEIERSGILAIYHILKRLELVKTFGDPKFKWDLFWSYGSVTTYLLLTCFDILGQPNEYFTFESWLRSSKKKKEREKVSIKTGNDHTTIALEMHKYYQSIYGVKTSFMNFINNVISSENKSKLLESILIEEVGIPKMGDVTQANDAEKMKYLYTLRNEFTHKGNGLAAFQIHHISADNDRWLVRRQYKTQDKLVTVSTRRWPDVLIEILQSAVEKKLRQYMNDPPS